jgi:hypothetical protein
MPSLLEKFKNSFKDLKTKIIVNQKKKKTKPIIPKKELNLEDNKYLFFYVKNLNKNLILKRCI